MATSYPPHLCCSSKEPMARRSPSRFLSRRYSRSTSFHLLPAATTARPPLPSRRRSDGGGSFAGNSGAEARPLRAKSMLRGARAASRHSSSISPADAQSGGTATPPPSSLAVPQCGRCRRLQWTGVALCHTCSEVLRGGHCRKISARCASPAVVPPGSVITWSKIP